MEGELFARYVKRLGLRLRGLREAQGVSQEVIAARAGIASYTYLKLEAGKSSPGGPANPQLRTLLGLAYAFDISIYELLPMPSDAKGPGAKVNGGASLGSGPSSPEG